MISLSLVFRCIAFVAALIVSSLAFADERITDFNADLTVETDGSLTVVETITVQAEGDQIKRGIFRDIPLFAEDANGWTYEVGFQLLSVEQDGQNAPYFTEEGGSGIRIYIGERDVFLEPGRYTYTISYQVDRQVRFFDAFDEVYWNVTGNEWDFPIDNSSARLRLPNQTQPTQIAAYTGGFGDSGQDYTTNTDPITGGVDFQTTEPLRVREGLTIAVGFPKGLVHEPTDSEKFDMWLQDQRVFAIGATGVAILLLYYLLSWWTVGRDPTSGVIIPRFKAPEGISPALANYITNRGIEGERWTALAAACLSLAVKGRITLSKEGHAPVLDLKAPTSVADAQPLPKGEAVVMTTLEDRGARLAIDKKNGRSIRTLGTKFASAITTEYRGVYFKSNGWYLLPGLIISIATMVALFMFANLSDPQFEQAFMFGFFSVFALAISAGLTHLVQLGLRKTVHLHTSIVAFWLIYTVILSILIYGISHFVALVLGGQPEIPLLPVFIIVIPILFFFYASVIDAPTMQGRQMLDAIEGLKLYLSVAEKERMNMAGAPDMSISHFEELLPYAVSLGVEKPWSTSFETWLQDAVAISDERSYRPQWYMSDDFGNKSIASSIGAATTAMASSFQSSLPVTKSSTSGSSGGGSSGGGGGGGGGGGW